jgi:hypothetical protein
VERLRGEAAARAEQGATQETVLRHTQLRNQQLAEQLQQVRSAPGLSCPRRPAAQ